MSRKYIPSFLKGAESGNQFSVLSDEKPNPEKTLVNTSLPARQAPKFVPMTLASLTSTNGLAVQNKASGVDSDGFTTVKSDNGPKKSYASRFSEASKIKENPGYKPAPKPLDITSSDDFPTLGSYKASNTVVYPIGAQKETKNLFAEKAKEWAKKKEADEERTRNKLALEEQQRRDMEHLKRMTGNIRFTRKEDEDEHENLAFYNQTYDDKALGEDPDGYEVPEGDESELHEGDGSDEDEFNPNIGWDGRRKDDLY